MALNPVQFIQSMIGNFTKGRNGKQVTRAYFHRTAIDGDTAVGEGNYFHNHCVKASFYKVIDKAGVVVQSTASTDTAWAVDVWGENQISLSYEFTGLNGSPLTPAQIKAAIADIKNDPATKKIAPKRLSIADIKAGKASGWANHRDVTVAYKIAGGHTDGISEAEIAQILLGIK